MKKISRNKNIIRHLADNTWNAQRLRNMFAVLTVTLSASLILVVTLYFTGSMQATREDLKTRYQVYYTGLNAAQAEAIRQDPSAEMTGEMLLLDTITEQDYELRLQYIDEGLATLSRYEWVAGELPGTAGQIAVNEGYLKHTGQSLACGEAVTLPTGESFIISGIIKSTSQSRIWTTLVSKDYALKHGGSKDGLSVYVKLADTNDYTEEELRHAAAVFAEKHGLEEQLMGFSSYYLLNMDKDSTSNWNMVLLLVLLTSICSGLVIYSILYVSVTSRMNEYGRLKALGVTERQLKHLVRIQADRLSLRGLLIALPVGNIAAFLMQPSGFQPVNAVVTSLAASVICWLSVRAAAALPARMAARVTPVEALRYTAAEEIATLSHHPLMQITPWGLAKRNLFRNPKKTILTLCSLSVSGILLLASAAYLNSLDAMELARRDSPFGDLTIQPAGKAESFSYGELAQFQQQNLFSQALENEILGIEGVQEIKRYQGVQVKWQFPSGLEEPQILEGLTPEDAARLSEGLTDGGASSLFSEKDTFWLYSPSTYQEVYHWTPKVGDTITVSLEDGSSRILTLAGILDEKVVYGGFNLFVSQELMRELSCTDADLTYQIAVSVDSSRTNEAETRLRQLCKPYPGLQLATVRDRAASLVTELNSQKAPVYVLVTIIGAFGLINPVNTLMTNLLTRKKELASMQAIGLSGWQLQQMLIGEGLLYSTTAILFSLAVGTLCGVGLCRLLSSFGTFGTPSYRFPAPAFASFAGILLLVQTAYSIFSTRSLQKKSLVERMRVED